MSTTSKRVPKQGERVLISGESKHPFVAEVLNVARSGYGEVEYVAVRRCGGFFKEPLRWVWLPHVYFLGEHNDND